MEDNFIVAIELGSSKVTAVAGRKQPDGAIHILACAQEPSTTFMRKGRINNISKMTQCLAGMKEKMEQKMQKSVSRVYVGIGGFGMHTVPNTVVRRFDSKIEVTQEMVDAMCDENRTMASGERDILEAVPQEYRLGTQRQTDPVGFLTDSIEGNYLNIVANASVREEIRNCFGAAGVKIADIPITLQALADVTLTESQKTSGCVFVDMGAETTSVAVYKNNLLRHLAVIPLGGANVNRDIMSLQIEDNEAEALKLKYGAAVADLADTDESPIALRDGRKIDRTEFAGLVEAREEEIVQNVANQIKLSGYTKEQLIGGIIVTGGASQMKNMDSLFRRVTQFDSIRFEHNIRVQLRTPDFPDFNKDGSFNGAAALVDKGNMNCCGGALGQNKPDIFAPDEAEEEKRREKEQRLEREREEDERRKREEDERLKREEEEQRKREEEAERKAERKAKMQARFKRIGGFFSKFVSDGEGEKD